MLFFFKMAVKLIHLFRNTSSRQNTRNLFIKILGNRGEARAMGNQKVYNNSLW
jgi:hypothetical protein